MHKIIFGYAAFFGFFYLFLSLRVIKLRMNLKVKLGDNGNALLNRAIRVHANFAEYVPFVLLLIALAEFNDAAKWIIHFLCASLVLGRVLHAYAVSQEQENIKLRVAGMMLTFLALTCVSLLLLVQFVLTIS